MRSGHTQPCLVCRKRYRRSHEDMCDKCHLANGGKLCQCGAHIERTDTVCRDCYSEITRPRTMTSPHSLRSNGRGQSDVASVDLSKYRIETTQVESASIEHDGDWSHLLSPEVRERYHAWRAGNPRRHGNARD